MDISSYYNNLISGQCWKTFWNDMPSNRKVETLIKTTLIAAAVGIIGALIKVPVGIIIGVAAGVAAFNYYTAAYTPKEKFKDYLSQGLDGVFNMIKKKTGASG